MIGLHGVTLVTMTTIYELEVVGGGPWQRFNIYVSLAGYTAAGERTAYGSGTFLSGQTPAKQKIVASCGPCVRAEGFLSMVAMQLPASKKVTDSPPFQITLIGRADGKELFRKDYEVNPWGGLSVAGLPLGK